MSGDDGNEHGNGQRRTSMSEPVSIAARTSKPRTGRSQNATSAARSGIATGATCSSIAAGT